MNSKFIQVEKTKQKKKCIRIPKITLEVVKERMCKLRR